MDYDAIIIGGGPAGLTAGRHLARADFRVLVLDRDSIGGRVMNVEWIEDYPNPGERTAGAALGASLADAAAEAGVRLELGDVEDVEIYSSSKAVSCAGGQTYTSAVIIMAGGVRPRKLGLPGEDRLAGKGVIHCALCDAGLYADRPVAVLGGGDVALIEAMYLADRGAKVSIIEAGPELSAGADLQKRARAHPNMAIRHGQSAVGIEGEDGVTGLVIQNAAGGDQETLDAYGVLIRVGVEPETDCLEAVLSLDDAGYAETNEDLESAVPGLILAGDIRLGSPRDVATAISDGARAAATAMQLLRD